MGIILPQFVAFYIFLLPLSMGKKIDKLQPSELFLLHNKKAFLPLTGLGVKAEHLG